jgi:hypothetical protein
MGENRTEIITTGLAQYEQEESCAFNTRVEAETSLTKSI